MIFWNINGDNKYAYIQYHSKHKVQKIKENAKNLGSNLISFI